MSKPLTDRPVFTFRQGTAPLLVSMPHAGTYVPPAIADRLTDEARHVPDTDWHLERLYDFVVGMGASVLVATHSRYVADLNRPPDGSSLYPGQSVTGLCPARHLRRHTDLSRSEGRTGRGGGRRAARAGLATLP